MMLYIYLYNHFLKKLNFIKNSKKKFKLKIMSLYLSTYLTIMFNEKNGWLDLKINFPFQFRYAQTNTLIKMNVDF